MVRYSPLLTLFTFFAALLGTQAQKPAEPAEKPVTSQSATNPFDSFQQFSAVLNGGLGQDHNRKIYRSGKFMRLDFADHYRVTDMDAPFTWLIFPDHCTTASMFDAGSHPFAGFRDFSVERSLTGEKETVDGHVCRIEMATFNHKGRVPKTVKMKLWEAEDLNGFPVKIEVDNGGKKFYANYSNVSLQPPDPKLFDHPTKCGNIRKLAKQVPAQHSTKPPESAPKSPPH